MKTLFEPEDISQITAKIIETIRPLLQGNGKASADKYLTMKELAAYTGLAYSTIANNKKYLPHTYLNGTPLFKRSEIDAFLEQFRVKPKQRRNNQRFAELFKGKLRQLKTA